METYRKLGVRPLINAASNYTKLGGSIMAPQVAQAMADASGVFVDLFALQNAVGARLAALTRNEAAYVCNGAAAGLALATAACMTGDDPTLMARLPNDTDGMKNEIVVHRAHRNSYDIAVRQVGAHLVEIGNIETELWQLDEAITERTAAVVYFAGPQYERTRTLPMPVVVERAHARGVPVIVDAAGQIPPASNLWRFTTEMGADAAIFSGGKGLCGPQNSGLVVGRETIVRAMRLNGPPHQRIGRGMKVSKEAMIGLLAAVEHYLANNQDAKIQGWSETVDSWFRAWRTAAPSGISVVRLEGGESGETIARVIIDFGRHAPIDRDGFIELLRRDDPVIEVVLHDRTSIALSPHLLQPDEAEVVEARVGELLAELGSIVMAAVVAARPGSGVV